MAAKLPLPPRLQRNVWPQPFNLAQREALLSEQVSIVTSTSLAHLLMLLAGVVHRDIKVSGGRGQGGWIGSRGLGCRVRGDGNCYAVIAVAPLAMR